jgi:hypothetical protein
MRSLLPGWQQWSRGLINALAGGGTLMSFPALIAPGVSGVAATITNTVALCPGYLGGAIAQREDLRGNRGSCSVHTSNEGKSRWGKKETCCFRAH